MAFRQHHRPQQSRQLSFQPPSPPAEVGAASTTQRKRPLEQSEEWVLFSPGAASTTARTQTTSTERTPRTAGLSNLSDFGSLDTAARSQDDDEITFHGTEEGEELDSLDDGLHAFHEPSEYGVPVGRLQQSGDTVLPTHDGLGTFQPDATLQDQLWQFERSVPRRRLARRRSSVQRRFDALEEIEEGHQELDRRQRIEKWRLEQSKALLEEIERETRRRRRMSMVSAARSKTDSARETEQIQPTAGADVSVSDGQSVSSDESSEQLTFWQRLTRRVIRDLMGIDEDTLSVIFGESLPAEAYINPKVKGSVSLADTELDGADIDQFHGEHWEQRLLDRVAKELGLLVHQLSEHPGAFSTYQGVQKMPEYSSKEPATAAPTTTDHEVTPTLTHSTASGAGFAPTYTGPQTSQPYTEASLWGIEEEPPSDPLDSFRRPTAPTTQAEDLAREQEYWERELDVKMVFNFLVKRFTSRRPSSSSHRPRSSSAPADQRHDASRDDEVSARRAAIIRQNHPLVGKLSDVLPTSSAHDSREQRRRETTYRAPIPPHIAGQSLGRNHAVVKSSSSCASLSTKKSKRSAESGRNYWDLGGSVGSASVLAGEA